MQEVRGQADPAGSQGLVESGEIHSSAFSVQGIPIGMQWDSLL